ncbi:hypothetical protein ACHAW5_009001 [Stephanodiscus triporus]|uniref:Casein kinase I n=1 Tax=Stephanodiscus triporus TaxID=2934178 RepID=A0ABD3PHC1_9STRA
MDSVDDGANDDVISGPHRSSRPPFPEPGSVIGPDDRYFCLGRLGKGTFCSIHKCVDLSHSFRRRHPDDDDDDDDDALVPTTPSSGGGMIRRNRGRRTGGGGRIVAAKVELANFVDSGVIDGEASVLRFLDSSLPDGSVPTFVDYVRRAPPSPPAVDGASSSSSSATTTTTPATTTTSATADGGLSAIIMEYLPGEDMHLLRDRHCQQQMQMQMQMQMQQGGGGGSTGQPAGGAGGGGGGGERAHPRRLSVGDAVYLVADVVLPLLKAMHEVGIVHRDVKPSNVVRTGTTPADRKFKMVDFGLSKSFVVPKDSSFADPRRPWTGTWMSPSIGGRAGTTTPSGSDDLVDGGNAATTTTTTTSSSGGCVRLEREYAEFRGTSMYGSLRVHQGKDHCPRDDVWGLLYVFCDLVSGGLPWMGHASARDRGSCQILKEMVMGERGRDDWAGIADSTTTAEGGKRVEGMASRPDPDKVPKDGGDAIEWLLFGAEYHNAKYKRDMRSQGLSEADVDSLPALPEPLAMSKNSHYVDCLRRAFRHVASLGFVELPDYDLIAECLRGFLRDVDPDDRVPPIDWKDRPASSKRLRRTISTAPPSLDVEGVTWIPLDEDADPIDDGALAEAEIDRRVALEAAAALEDTSRSAKFDGNGGAAAASALDPGASLTGEAADLARLPLQLQFRLSQVEYNARHPDAIPPHVALRDWMALAIPLAHGTWDTATWERGNHRTDDDGYRNEVRMSMLQKCLDAADPFNRFSDRECYYHPLAEGETKAKRRRVGTSAVPHLVSDDSAGGADDNIVFESPLVVVSRVFFSLRLALDMEQGKNFAPPPKLSFGFGRA